MQNKIIDELEKSQSKKRPNFRVGDRVNISVRLKEGDKERVQAFRGLVISKQPKSGKGPTAMFTVRKISEGVGVERIFPVHSPFIEKIEVETSNEIRRSRLYYLRDLKGKKARLKEAGRFADAVAVEEPAAVAQTVASDAAAPKAEAPKAEKADKKEKSDKK